MRAQTHGVRIKIERNTAICFPLAYTQPEPWNEVGAASGIEAARNSLC